MLALHRVLSERLAEEVHAPITASVACIPADRQHHADVLLVNSEELLKLGRQLRKLRPINNLFLHQRGLDQRVRLVEAKRASARLAGGSEAALGGLSEDRTHVALCVVARAVGVLSCLRALEDGNPVNTKFSESMNLLATVLVLIDELGVVVIVLCGHHLGFVNCKRVNRFSEIYLLKRRKFIALYSFWYVLLMVCLSSVYPFDKRFCCTSVFSMCAVTFAKDFGIMPVSILP